MPRPPPPAAALTIPDIRSRLRSGAPRPRPDRALRAGDAGDAEPRGGALGLDLVAHQPDVFGLRADEGDLVLLEDIGEARVLGQKPVAGMDGVGAGDLAGGDDGGNVEIAVLGGGRPDADALVRELDVHRLLVGGRIDGDRGDAELLGRAHDAQRDLSPVGNEDFIEHRGSTRATARHSMTISGWSYSTGEPSATRMLTTCRPRGDDVVERLHRLDQQQLVAGLHRRAQLDEGFGVRTRAQIGRADHRRFDRAGEVVDAAGLERAIGAAGPARPEARQAAPRAQAPRCVRAPAARGTRRGRFRLRSDRIATTILASWSIARDVDRVCANSSDRMPDGFFMGLGSLRGNGRSRRRFADPYISATRANKVRGRRFTLGAPRRLTS